MTRTVEIIETKAYRNTGYDIIYDGKQYCIMRSNSMGTPEFMTYHDTLDEATMARQNKS
ncbi:hypothetical protein [Legionella maceachernii]|uniref:Uncharacterized protein n=1 Tax=Legionella maceachernii TaxID=466 RepID=A0A0W0WBF2_9GAMM|nr:hypothetical protein [Legionella maceachernii]KTD29687.1 hypothetical protein Lmac_0862 [Legionella maceachernii]SKA21126.1 hypothetical protein SAMN02745128_02606 [Legionella maceachernii]SUP02572.1 Uncharacterised protein [Legionella maceachernii]